MPNPSAPLDDLTYADLLAEARALIPSLDPGWTDHNPSDPGIALVELLAWLTEMLIFQVGEISPAHTQKFLHLLNGPDWQPPAGDIAEAVGPTIRALRERYRAATPEDYEYLVLSAWPGYQGRSVRRVRCIPERNLAAADPQARLAPAPAHVSVVVLPEPLAGEQLPVPPPELLADLAAFLLPRRILTTRHHVVGPQYVDLAVSARVALMDGGNPAAALTAVALAVQNLFSPITGADGQGWPFGRDLYLSEVYAALERVPLVDYLEDLAFSGPPPLSASDGQIEGAALDVHELVALSRVQLVGYDTGGRTYPFTWTPPSRPATAVTP